MARRKKIIFGGGDDPAEVLNAAPVERESGKYTGLSEDKNFQKKIGKDVREPEEKKEETTTEVKVLVVFQPKDIYWIFDVYAVVTAFIFASALKCKFEEVHEICKFDDVQKEALAEPIAEVASKYFPEDWIKYLPEIKVAMLLASITGAKFHQARELINAKTLKQEKAA